MAHNKNAASSVNIESYTTLPRKHRDRLPTAEELQNMSLERRLATLNITQSRTPVPPPRVKRFQRRVESVPDNMTSSPTNIQNVYNDKSYSFDEDTKKKFSHNDGEIYRSKQQYHKYEVTRKDISRDSYETQPMCDIIQSSQRPSPQQAQMVRPDILRGSFNADLKSRRAESMAKADKETNSYRAKLRNLQREKTLDDNKNITHDGTSSNPDRLRNKQHEPNIMSSNKYNKHSRTSDQKHLPKATSTPNKVNGGSSNRFMFYRPKVDKLHKQNNSAIGLVGMAEVNYDGGSLMASPEGSFINPAFDIVDNNDKKALSKSTSAVKPVTIPKKPVYSTMGSSFSARPCTPSPPSHRFRNPKPPMPSPEPEISPIRSHLPSPLKPIMSTKQIETSLKQYPSQTRLDTSDMCSPQAMENMLRYYNMTSTSNDPESNSPTPPPMKLSSSKKNQSPYSSTGSLNVSGDSIDVVLRRKKKVKIRPPSFTSEDDLVKRVSLEINLTPNTSQSTPTPFENETSQKSGVGLSKDTFGNSSLSVSQTSLNQQTVEKLDLDDLTSTETAKLLRKQFAKLKVKASTLKVKDTELKQRFANLQNQRGRVCGHGGSISKPKIRSSPILL